MLPDQSNVVHICLPIADRRRAMEFYATVFDLEPLGPPAEDGIPEPLQFELDSRVRLMLIPTGGFGWVLGERTVAAPGTSECVLSTTLATTADVDRLVERIDAAGGHVLVPAEQKDWGYTALCSDPDGHAWQLIAGPQVD